MGVYYKAACDSVRESIDPGDINNLGNKIGAIAHPEHPFGAVLVFAMTHCWSGRQVRIIPDEGCEEVYEGYTDVTAAVLSAYNDAYKTAYTAKGPRRNG